MKMNWPTKDAFLYKANAKFEMELPLESGRKNIKKDKEKGDKDNSR